MEFLIRKAGSDDSGTVGELASRLWPHHSASEMTDEIGPLLSDPAAAVFLLFDGEDPVGFAQCQLRCDYVERTSSSPVGYLEGIFVEERCRGKSCAQRLLDECERWAKARGCSEFVSDCELGNEGSIAFHLASGFEEAARIVCFRKSL